MECKHRTEPCSAKNNDSSCLRHNFPVKEKLIRDGGPVNQEDGREAFLNRSSAPIGYPDQ